MYYVKYVGGSTNNAFVETIVRTELLSDEEKLGGFEIEEIPQPQMPDGYSAILRANPTDKTVFYEFIKDTPTPNQRLEIIETENILLKKENEVLKSRQELMQRALDDFILLGGMI